MPIVPYHYGGGQLPLQELLPSSTLIPYSSAILPTYVPAAVKPAYTFDDIPIPAPVAPQRYPQPTIDLPQDHLSHAKPEQTSVPSSVSLGRSSNCSEQQMKGWRAPIVVLSTLLSLFTLSELYQKALFKKITPPSERLEESHWVASSQSWADRKSCKWFGFCGLAHLNKAGWTKLGSKSSQRNQQSRIQGGNDAYDWADLSSFWTSGKTNPEEWSEDERVLREIPQYVLEYAPYVHLYSGEEFWPCDIAEHLIHTTPHLNYTPMQASSDHPNLANLDDLNKWGRFVYLQSDDNVEERPEWLGGKMNIPNQPEGPDDGEKSWADWDGRVDGELPDDANGGRKEWYDVGLGDTVDRGGIRPIFKASTTPIPVPTNTPEGEELLDEDFRPETLRRLGKRASGGRSDAPAVLITVDKGNGVVDAFWFFFYSYNLGNSVLNVRFGNHVGDWEHTVIRFSHGKPKAVFFSEHSFGEAYSYEAVEKIGKRVSKIILRVRRYRLILSSLSHTRPLGLMQCMPQPVITRTFFRGGFCTM